MRSLPFIVLPVALLVLLSLVTGVRAEGLAISFGVFFIGVFAVDRYVSLGPRSQEWQEGKRGARMRALQEETGESLFVPEGLVPSLLTTFQVALFGLLLIVATVYAGRLWPALLLLPSLLFGAGLMVHLIRFRSGFDRWFYATHALYSELFRSAGGLEVSDRAPVGVSSLYWVPRRVRPHVWLRLVQLDRRLPMGRVLGVAYVAVCVLYAISPSPLLRVLGLMAIVLGKNAAVGLVSNQALAPQPFLSTFESTGGAVLSRLFVNLRWTLPWVILLAVLVVFADGFGGYEMVVWTSLDITAAVLLAWGFAFVPSIRLRYA